MTRIEIAPIVKRIDVRRSARDAFNIFTAQISAWWPIATHTRARIAEGERTVSITIEPRAGGRVFETLQDGRELDWGIVTAFEPGVHFAMQWRMGRPEAQSTDVSVRFEPVSPSTCRVTLTHENWERIGEQAQEMRDNYNNGWVSVFEHGFGALAERMGE